MAVANESGAWIDIVEFVDWTSEGKESLRSEVYVTYDLGDDDLDDDDDDLGEEGGWLGKTKLSV